MKYARIVNNCAVDTRTDSPVGCFTDNIVAEFTQVPDDVVDGWIIADGSWSAPIAHVPTDAEIAEAAAFEAAAVEFSRISILKAAIELIEIDHPITPRQLRELALIVRQVIQVVAPTHPPVHGLEVANDIDTQIVALRVQM